MGEIEVEGGGATQRSIALALFKRDSQRKRAGSLRFNIEGFCTPNLIFGGARNLMPPRDGASGQRQPTLATMWQLIPLN